MTSSQHGIDLPDALRRRLATSRGAVAFTGAGISRESGLDTFRDAGGLWQKVRPEEMATPEAFARQPAVVWSWYAARYRGAAGVQPNPAHHALARWEALFPEFTLVTQNVDGLHQRAGSRELIELHGTLATARCHACGTERPMAAAVEASPDRPPVCACGGLFRPAVVWFGEMLPAGAIERATRASATADLFVAVGTSGQVYPAAGLIEVAHRAGAVVIEINPEPTPLSALADLSLRAPAGDALPALTATLGTVLTS
jgi:NAD-dependent deacetylase